MKKRDRLSWLETLDRLASLIAPWRYGNPIGEIPFRKLPGRTLQEGRVPKNLVQLISHIVTIS